MNLAANAPYWLIGILFTLLLLATLEDGWRLRISNILPLGVAAAGIIAILVVGLSASIWQNALLFAVTLLVGSLAFGARLLGGGDVKLLAACMIWFDLRSGWQLVMAIAIAGGLLAIVILAARQFTRGLRDSRWIVLRPKGGIPYGIAIGFGTAFMVAAQR